MLTSAPECFVFYAKTQVDTAYFPADLLEGDG